MEPMITDPKKYVRNIPLDLVLTLLLCGLWNIVVQQSQFEVLNSLLKEEKYVLWKFIVFSLLTCGIYIFYIEYNKAKDLARLMQRDETSDVVLAMVLAFFGFHWVFDAIAQDKLNDHLQRNLLA